MTDRQSQAVQAHHQVEPVHPASRLLHALPDKSQTSTEQAGIDQYLSSEDRTVHLPPQNP